MGIQYARPTGNKTIFFGTSITSIGSVFPDGSSRGASCWATWACLLSNSQILWVRNAGALGDTTVTAIARFDRDILPYINGIDIVVIEQGTNDAYVDLRPVAQFASNIKTLVTRVLSLGKIPILCTVMQRSDIGSTLVEQYNAFLQQFALLNGIDLWDFYSAVINPATGLTNVANTSDGLHPSNAGARLMGQAAATAALNRFAKPSAVFVAEHQQAWSANIVANALGTNNAGGLFTGFTKTGTGTASLVAPSGNVLGQRQRLTAVDATSCSINSALIVPGPAFQAGDTIAFSGYFQSSTITAGGAYVEIVFFNSGLTAAPALALPGAIAESLFYGEFVIPPGTIAMDVYIQLAAGVAANDFVQIAQPTIVNLSQLGNLL